VIQHSPFTTIAEGFGCEATRVETTAAAGRAVADALTTGDTVTLIEVGIDGTEPTASQVADYESRIDFTVIEP
jgi:thiamine pyrophosphate-dependent acetolactate synthase large subunit-like protein